MDVIGTLAGALPAIGDSPQLTTTDLKKSSAHIHDLPAELLIDITDRIPRDDISAVRLASRDLCAAVEDRFLNEYFIEKSQYVTTHSLKNLVSITETPRMRDKKQRITFLIARLPNHCSTGPCEHYDKWPDCKCVDCERRYAAFPELSDKYDEYKDAQGLVRDVRTGRSFDPKFYAGLKLLMCDGLGDHLLTTALGNLKNAHVYPHLAMASGVCRADEKQRDIRHQDTQAWATPLDPRGYEKWEGCTDLTQRVDVSSLILHSIAAADFPVESLQLLTDDGRAFNGFHRVEPEFPYDRLPIDRLTIIQLKSCFSQLTSLRLGGVLWTDNLLPQAWYEPFREIIKAATGTLTHISLDFEDLTIDSFQRPVSQGLVWASETFRDCNLTHINILGGVFWGTKDVSLLFQHHTESLVHFKVERAVIDEMNGLCQELAAKAVNLKNVELGDINREYLESPKEENYIRVSDEDGEDVGTGLRTLVAGGYFDRDPWANGPQMYHPDHPPRWKGHDGW